MQKDDEQIEKLNNEIGNLKKALAHKVEKYKHISHPEVILASQMLDQKILEFMKFVNTLQEIQEKES